MPEKLFFPYRYEQGVLDIAATGLRIDSQPHAVDEYVDMEHGAIYLAGHPGWANLELDILVSDTNDILPDLALPSEDAHEAISLHAIVQCGPTRLRKAFPLAGTSGSWQGKISLQRKSCAGAARFTASAVRNRSGPPSEDRAFRRGELVADSERWTIYVDEKPTLPGGAIEGSWRDFGNDDLDALRAHADCLWYIDLQGDRPRLFLNEGIEGFRKALEAPQRIGKAARIRDSLIHSVLQPVLLAFATKVIASADGCGVDELDGWKRSILLHLAGTSNEGTPELVADRWLAGWKQEDPAKIVAEIGAAVQRHLHLERSTELLVRQFEGSTDG